MFEIKLIQTESSVSVEGHFLLDGDLAQDVTVGTPAIRMKTSESSGPKFDPRNLSQIPKCLQVSLLPKLEALCPWTNSFH